MLTYLAALLLAVVPGAVLGWSLPAGRARWVVWSAAPALTLGLTAAAMGWLPVVGLPSGAVAVLVGELVLAILLVVGMRLVAARRTSRSRGGHPTTSPAAAIVGTERTEPADGGRRGHRLLAPVERVLHRSGLPRLADLVCVGVPSLFTVFFGHRFLGGIAQPPGWDAMNHAFFVRRMLDTGSTSVADVCVTGSTQVEPSCSFYPLAANVHWAQTVELTGGRVGTAMLGWGIVVAPLAMVVGVYAAVRLLGGRPLVAMCAAAMPTLLGPLWMSLRTGRMTEQAAPCMAAGVALLVGLALRSRHPVRLGALAAVAGAGIVMSHSYDVLFMGTVALGITALAPARYSTRALLAGLASMAVAGVAVLAPFVGSILGANAERTASKPTYDTFAESWQFWVLDLDRYVLFGFPVPGTATTTLSVPSVRAALVLTLLALAAAPLCFVLRQLRWARPWVAAGIVWTLIGLWTSYSTHPVALALSGLWYGIRERVRNMILPVYGLTALAGACAIGIVLYAVAGLVVRRLRAVAGGPHHAAAATAVVFVAALTAYGVQQPTWEPLRKDLLRRSPSDASYGRTFAWLRDNTRPGAVVAYDRHLEFMTWSYADHGTDLLFGIPPLTPSSRPDYADRWAAFSWLADNKDAAPAGCLVRGLDVQYLAVGQRRMPGWSAHYSRARLAASPNVRLVHRDGGLQVYAVTTAGRACPGAT